MNYFQALCSILLRSTTFADTTFAMTDYSSNLTHSPVHNDSSHQTYSSAPKKIKRFFKKSPFLPVIVLLVFVILVAFFAIRNISSTTHNSTPALLANDKRETIDKPQKQQILNRSFNFPLRDGSGKVVSQLQYDLQSAEIRNEIIVKGQRATAVKGRTFLIINLKITNSYDKSVQLNSKDYVRLIVGSSPEKLAADIHNDPVDVQAISTKYTRLGFPVNDNETSLTLQVGEITGKKDLIKLNLN